MGDGCTSGAAGGELIAAVPEDRDEDRQLLRWGGIARAGGSAAAGRRAAAAGGRCRPAELGVKTMRHDVTRGFGENAKKLRIPKTFDAAVKYVVPAIRDVADYGAVGGHQDLAGKPWVFHAGIEAGREADQGGAHPNFGLTIDLGNFMCVDEDPVAATKRLAKYVIMAHAKDFHVKPKKLMPATGWFATPTEICLRGAIAGHGVLDLPAQLKLLKKAGYNGYLSLEFEGMEEPAQGIKLGLDYLREQLKAL